MITPSRFLPELATRATQLPIALSSITDLEKTCVVRVYYQLLMKIYGFHKQSEKYRVSENVKWQNCLIRYKGRSDCLIIAESRVRRQAMGPSTHRR